jgi:hypothetical protein
MGELTDLYPTLLDIARRKDPNGKIDKIAEMMTQTNEILLDMPFYEGNLETGHKSTIRTGLPTATWRKLYGGVLPGKSTTTQVTDTCGMLENYAEIDKDLALLNGNSAEFRVSEDRAFIEGMNQQMAATLIYGDTDVNPERFLGLAPRFTALSTTETNIGFNIIDGGAAAGQTDCTSVWLVVWGPDTVFGMFPKGSVAGLQHKDLGEQTKTNSDSSMYQVLRSHYQWKNGLVVKNWQYIVRVANLDKSALATAGESSDSSPNLINKMIDAIERIPNLGMGKAVFYGNRYAKSCLRKQLKNCAELNLEDVTGAGGIVRKELTFGGIPFRRVDQILYNESVIS